MEHRLLSGFQEDPNLSSKSAKSALSLITNPFTSDHALSSLTDTLKLHLQNPNSNHQEILSLLSAISLYHPHFRHLVAAVAHAFMLLPSTPTPSIPHAISLLDPAHSEPFSDESLFLSLCFRQCVKTRIWTLRNMSKFRVRPSVLLTVLLGFTKDPYPYVRIAALDGLVLLCNGIVVEDWSLIEGCYFRAVELLFDSEKSVRCAALRAVSEWGQFIVALKSDKSKKEWSDALFVQLCLMSRDMDMEIRVAAFTELGKIQTVSEDILVQTLSKKASAAIKGKNYPGQYTFKMHNIPASASVFTFIHGLEDEFYEVRRSACRALQMLTVVSAEFAGEAVHRLMDLLNDDSEVVRLQALETLQYMTIYNLLKLEESHLHMFFGALIDSSALIRSAARKALQSTKLQKLAMFKSCIDSLVKNLELYPQDEAELFSVLFKLGRTHGNFVVSIILEVSQQLEPFFDGKLDFYNARTAALLVLAISAPVSFVRQICSIPPQIFSYAVTLLGRISCGLIDVMDKNTLLTYLSHCSRFTIVSASEFFKGDVRDFQFKDRDIQLLKKCSEISGGLFHELMELKKAPLHDYQLNLHVKATSCTVIVFQKVVDLWPLLQLGCQNEVILTLRNLMQEVRQLAHDSNQPAGVLVFVSEYLHVIKLLGKSWACYLSIKNFQFNAMGVLEALLGKAERRLNELLYRYTGLSREDELHILELLLVTYTLRLSYRETCFDAYMKKMNFVLSRVEHLHKEGSIELSHYIVELRNISCEVGNSEDESIHELDMLQTSLHLFAPRHFVLSGELKHIEACMDVHNNDFQNPLPFISGLPVGVPFEITLYNISSETRLWLTMTLSESTQFVFLDLQDFGGCNEMRKFTFIAPVYRTPKVKFFSLKVSIAMECLSEIQPFKHCIGPKHELVHLCKEKEVYLSMAVE